MVENVTTANGSNATNQSHYGGLNLLKLKYRFGFSVESVYNFNF